MAEPEVGEHPPGLLDLPDEIYRQIAGSLDVPSFCRLFASWRQSREVLGPDHTARKGLRAVLKKYRIDPNATAVGLFRRTGLLLDVVVPALATMPYLTRLNLNKNLIEDVAPLQALLNLKQLSLTLNQIEDVTPLQALLNLTWLNLRDNKIENVVPLQSLTNLKRLYLTNNPIHEDHPSVQVLRERGVTVIM